MSDARRHYVELRGLVIKSAAIAIVLLSTISAFQASPASVVIVHPLVLGVLLISALGLLLIGLLLERPPHD